MKLEIEQDAGTLAQVNADRMAPHQLKELVLLAISQGSRGGIYSALHDAMNLNQAMEG